MTAYYPNNKIHKVLYQNAWIFTNRKAVKVTRPFELLGCDMIGPFHQTEQGNCYIFMATDYYTKWVEAFPIPNKTALEVSKCLKKILYRHGAVFTILTDQGRAFQNKVNKHICDEWNIKHKVTTAYHPQTNGLDERTNQTEPLSRKGTKYVRKKWMAGHIKMENQADRRTKIVVECLS